MNKVLVLDDEQIITKSIKDHLDLYQVDCFNNPQEALDALEINHYRLIVSDYRMPEMTGIEFLQKARQKDAYDKAILMTAFAEKEILMEAINQGLIHKVMEKPLNLKELESSLGELQTQVVEEMHQLFLGGNPREGRPREEKIRLIGVRGDLAEVYQTLKSAAVHSERILITGEPGSGKEVQARAYHDLSANRRGTFVKVHCGSLPDLQLDSLLFGHKKGAFPGAFADKLGAVSLATGGTLFLDDITDMPVPMQRRFLKLLKTGRFSPLGAEESKSARFQLVCASREPLEPLIERGYFLEELFEAIGGITLTIPPLNQRPRDLKRFLHHFVEKFSLELGRMPLSLHKASVKKLKGYSWPGNISELEGVIKRAVVLTDPSQKIIPEDAFDFLFLSDPMPEDPEYCEAIQILARTLMNRNVTLKEIEHNILDTIVQYTGGSITRAVDRSGIPKDRFYRYFKKKTTD